VLIAAVLVTILRESLRSGTGADVLGQLGLADRRAAYANMLQLTAIFAGFSGVGFAIYLGLGSRAVRQIKLSAGVPLLRVWLAALVTPWVCTLVLVFCGIMDRGGKDSGNVVRWVALAALGLVILQLGRIVWVFYELAVTDLKAEKDVRLEESEPIRTVGHRAWL
jgi:hypothetical protein